MAILRTEKTAHMQFRPEMVDGYDVLLATNLFENVADPLNILYETAQHIWGAALQAMGVEPL